MDKRIRFTIVKGSFRYKIGKTWIKVFHENGIEHHEVVNESFLPSPPRIDWNNMDQAPERPPMFQNFGIFYPK